jgi:DNA-binding beta-propeller fold protein YncE
MKSFFLICFFFLFFALAQAQIYTYSGSFGKFNNAAAFYINSAGYIYVTDKGTNQIIKLDTLGSKLKENGGFGWENETFDDPSAVFASTLNVFVCDRNNHRVQFFDKDLNYASQINTRESDNPEMTFGYPNGVCVNKQGDLFVLDQENVRVVKFDLFGNFLMNFGGYNYGNYSLSAPLKLAAGPANNVYVAEKKRLVIFDQYGNGINQIEMETEIKDINIIFDKLSVVSGNDILAASLSQGEISFNKLILQDYEEGKKILSSLIFNDKLYILLPGQIDVFTKGGK